jgi:hypothetical protein
MINDRNSRRQQIAAVHFGEGAKHRVRGFPTREVTGICIDDAILMLTGI